MAISLYSLGALAPVVDELNELGSALSVSRATATTPLDPIPCDIVEPVTGQSQHRSVDCVARHLWAQTKPSTGAKSLNEIYIHKIPADSSEPKFVSKCAPAHLIIGCWRKIAGGKAGWLRGEAPVLTVFLPDDLSKDPTAVMLDASPGSDPPPYFVSGAPPKGWVNWLRFERGWSPPSSSSGPPRGPRDRPESTPTTDPLHSALGWPRSAW